MFNLIANVLGDIVMSLQFSGWLEVMAIITCLMLLGSPGAIATILGAGTKLGIYNFVRENKKAKAES